MENIGFDKLIKKNASVDDTLALIIKSSIECSKMPFVKSIVEKLGPTTPKSEFIRRVFDYYCRNVEYTLDKEGTESVHTPALVIVNGKGDCKKAATFLASVLIAAGIEPIFKHVYYDGSDLYTHIYIIVGNPDYNNYITLDPTNDCKFNKEVDYRTGTLYFTNGKHMELRLMGASKPQHHQQHHQNYNNRGMFNIPFATEIYAGSDEMCGIIEETAVGFNLSDIKRLQHLKPHPQKNFIPAHKTFLHHKDIHPHHAVLYDIFEMHPTKGLMAGPEYISGFHLFEKLKEVVQVIKKDIQHVAAQVGPLLSKVVDKFKTVSLAIPRGAFLGLVELNVHGLATHLIDAWNIDHEKVDNKWKSIGGDPNILKKAMVSGSKRKAILGPDNIMGYDMVLGPEDIQGYGTINGPQYVGVVVATGLAAAIASATPVLVMISKMIHEMKPNSPADAALSGVAAGAVGAASDPAFNPNAPEFVAHMDATGNPVYPPSYPGEAPGQYGPPHSGNICGSVPGFIFKVLLLLILNPFHFNPSVISVLSWIAIVAPITIYYGFIKKQKTWQT